MAKTFHRITAVLLLAFIVVHLGGHLIAVLGPSQYRAYILVARDLYRRPYVELALILLLSGQALSGLALAVSSFQRPEPRGFLSWVELVSAAYFLAFILIHLAAIGVTRYFFEIDTDFYWSAALMRPSRAQYFIIGFHMLGVVAVTTHIGIGLKYFLESVGAAKAGRATMVAAIGAGSVVGSASVAAYSGALFDIQF